MSMKQIAPNLYVGPQIGAASLGALAAQGFTDVVCHLPDAEGAGSDQMATAATAAGLGFHYAPITPGQPFDRQSQTLAKVVNRPDAKVLAYCRSGARASNAWAQAQTRR